MRSPDAYKLYIDRCLDLSPEEKEIVNGYIKHRTTVQKTSPNTRIKQTAICIWVVRRLHEHDQTLSTCTVHDILTVMQATNDSKKNTRQTYIVQIKSLLHYLHRFNHPIIDLDLLDEVKAGSPDKNRKEALTLAEWNTVLNYPMSARHRAMVAMMYDGYHRPREVLILKWLDLKRKDNGIEYSITFKTGITRTIVQKPGTTEILENWRRECGEPVDSDNLIFPALDGKPYESILSMYKFFMQLQERTGIKKLKPSALRTTALTHDVEAGLPISYICLRAWGVPFNELINLYTRPDSGKIQREQHQKDGIRPAILGTTGAFTIEKDKTEEAEFNRFMMDPDRLIRLGMFLKKQQEQDKDKVSDM